MPWLLGETTISARYLIRVNLSGFGFATTYQKYYWGRIGQIEADISDIQLFLQPDDPPAGIDRIDRIASYDPCWRSRVLAGPTLNIADACVQNTVRQSQLEGACIREAGAVLWQNEPHRLIVAI